MATADLILHPVRLRIVRAFLSGRPLTTSALGAELADVPPASLYRHVARLAYLWLTTPGCTRWPPRSGRGAAGRRGVGKSRGAVAVGMGARRGAGIVTGPV